jgi:site-specific DNA recombinase
MSVRKERLETAKLATLQEHLLTEEHIRLFTDEFGREMQQLSRQDASQKDVAQHRLKQVTTELDNLFRTCLPASSV